MPFRYRGGMTQDRVPLRATWEGTEEPAQLELTYDGSRVTIHGLRPGLPLSVDFVELLAAVVTSERGDAAEPPERPGLDAAA
jgi:hypothetical protein